MDGKNWLKVAIFLCLIAVSSGREFKVKAKNKHHAAIYNHTLATILVEYASAVYVSDLTELFAWTCSRCNDLTKGFQMLELIVDVQRCLQAFVGVAQDLNAIVIAFRGTQERSLQNWIEDLYWKQLDISYPGMEDAMVHHGFYSAYHNTSLRPGVLSAVKRAKEFYGDIQIIVTGHSMGGAMAAFCGLDLTVHLGCQNILVMTFGQPRIGNAAFVSYYRVWLYDLGFGSLVYTVEKVCDNSGEDPSCSRSVKGNSIMDHLRYFGVKLACDVSAGCRIVMDNGLASYRTADSDGNVIFSRNISSSVLRMNVESSEEGKSL